MSWDYFVSQAINLHVKDRIPAAHATRQKRTAARILERLVEQPGVILADEVGMGKTFVALAVGASIAIVNPDAGPVVVMVPPSVKDKWPRDFKVFSDRCLDPIARGKIRASERTLESGLELLKLLDDPRELRKEIIFLTHGALSRGLQDPWVKLAMLRHVCSARRLSEIRDVLPRFAGRLLMRRNIADEVWSQLLAANPKKWRAILDEAGVELDDDPVPEALINSVDELKRESISAIADALDYIPKRESANSEERVLRARQDLNAAFQAVWSEWLSAACRRVRLPLLILDEAHHLKNTATQLATLFRSEEGAEDEKMLAGPLNGVFERMLFLTATPFQLGHAELLNVLERFRNIAWVPGFAPTRAPEQFKEDLTELRKALDVSQLEALGLNRAWGRLRAEHIAIEGKPATPEAWWPQVLADPAPGGLPGDVVARYRSTEAAARRAERLLQPWLIRHLKPRNLGETGLDASAPRRKSLPGAAILDELHGHRGLDITPEALLPFLLAARAQASISHEKSGRALFAEGLASSFEAYRDTRNQAHERDEDEESTDGSVPQVATEVDWYLQRIEEALPRDADSDKAARSHPKVAATVKQVVNLWLKGEKALVFCHYRATGKALERHISHALDTAINETAASRFGCSQPEAEAKLKHLGERLNRLDDVLRQKADKKLRWLVKEVGGMSEEDTEAVVDVMRRFLRTPSFLARYFPAEEGADAIGAALLQKDASGLVLHERLERFCRFLAVRCTPEERAEYLDALGAIQTGERYGREDLDGSGGVDAAKLIPNVRLANGGTRDETRRRLLLAFNTPFFPEVLVASSVLAEGVDLHLDCRFVIHHDLCWNPSTLEQRTGRVDRLGAKAEQAGAPIHIYLPYVAATQDEKMYRVVHDRERWFQVVMGQKFELDEASTDKHLDRVPLPLAIAETLGFKLET